MAGTVAKNMSLRQEQPLGCYISVVEQYFMRKREKGLYTPWLEETGVHLCVCVCTCTERCKSGNCEQLDIQASPHASLVQLELAVPKPSHRWGPQFCCLPLPQGQRHACTFITCWNSGPAGTWGIKLAQQCMITQVPEEQRLAAGSQQATLQVRACWLLL